MDDGFSAEKNGASERFFFFFFFKFDFPKKWSERRTNNFFSRKEEAHFFQRKKRNIDMIFRWRKKIGVSRQKWSGEIIIKKIGPPPQKKKPERQNIYFFFLTFNHVEIEAANPSSIKLFCCGLSKKNTRT